MAFMSDNEIKNQTLNLLMKELRKLDYFRGIASTKMLSFAFCILSEKIGASAHPTTQNEELDSSIKSMIFKH
tara:strand:- start:4616 stop:4831 length:216 start_codon:yes stop_codon:yes gene_type:complete